MSSFIFKKVKKSNNIKLSVRVFARHPLPLFVVSKTNHGGRGVGIKEAYERSEQHSERSRKSPPQGLEFQGARRAPKF